MRKDIKRYLKVNFKIINKKLIKSLNKDHKKDKDSKVTNSKMLYYQKRFYDLARKYNISELETNKNIEDIIDFDFIFNICLSYEKLHKEFVLEMFPDKKYYSNREELIADGYDLQYFFYAKDKTNMDSIKDNNSICVKRRSDDKVFVGFVLPTVATNIVYDDYFFVSNSIYAYYYNTKTIELGGGTESNISDILKYMESNDISDLHFQLLDEYSYYFTARFGQDIINITNAPINKQYVDKIYNQALIKIGKDSLSNPPEVSGLLKERLLSKSGKLTDRTFRFHSMFDNKGQFQGRAVSIRKLMNYEEITSLGLTGLNYSQQAIDLLNKAASNSHGIVFITGKTNSGKSTLLYCILSALYEDGKRIKSIESPVEVVAPFSQVDLTATEDAEEKYRMTRDIAVAALLRQDPDVVLIQEVRNDEEVQEFIELGLKGHLAYSTIHTGSVQETILRILKKSDQKVLKESLKLIVTQELVGKKCQVCKGVKLDKKCDNCNGLGVKGLLPVYEMAYFKDVSNYDITNMKQIVLDNKVDYISKKDIAREYRALDLINDKDFNRIMNFEKDLRE
ncbi:MAG: Flp pilus assembly complex ATPase component [Arcobacter sp.]|nr:Flp pilus assembly complex ATPase component [Arcobacter sp.]